MPDRFSPLDIFLDSNVLFSASRIENHRFLNFWRMRNVTPTFSAFAINEVRRNIATDAHHTRFEKLLLRISMVSDGPMQIIPAGINLALKDQPILATAIFASMNYLITGDLHHFGHLYGSTVAHVKILSPTAFLETYNYRLNL